MHACILGVSIFSKFLKSLALRGFSHSFDHKNEIPKVSAQSDLILTSRIAPKVCPLVPAKISGFPGLPPELGYKISIKMD